MHDAMFFMLGRELDNGMTCLFPCHIAFWPLTLAVISLGHLPNLSSHVSLSRSAESSPSAGRSKQAAMASLGRDADQRQPIMCRIHVKKDPPLRHRQGCGSRLRDDSPRALGVFRPRLDRLETLSGTSFDGVARLQCVGSEMQTVRVPLYAMFQTQTKKT